ncbi:hypothetical protein Daus18300_002948 [Diaporthe australafricana]|uniref:Uncharacterized protein n=1 Tax=Diaporthe australafricana TaxID=127596 RepID=A0ABR3XL24_9PEZI
MEPTNWDQFDGDMPLGMISSSEGEISDCDLDTKASTLTRKRKLLSDAESSGDVGLRQIAPNPLPNAASSGNAGLRNIAPNPFFNAASSGNVGLRNIAPKEGPGFAPSDFSFSLHTYGEGTLVWAPKSWRSDIKPILRFMVMGSDSRMKIKYLTWDQSRGHGLGENLTGRFFNSDAYYECEPFSLMGGDWNHATLCFYGGVSDNGEWEVDSEISRRETIVLPTLSDKAIWAEKPSVEWAGLNFVDAQLRET